MEIRHIAVGVDGSTNARAGLRWAREMAARTGASLEVVMAWSYPQSALFPIVGGPVAAEARMQEATSESLSSLLAEVGLERTDVRETVTNAVPGTALREASRHADLLVVGRTGASRLNRLLVGSTTGYLARHAHCPVAIINNAPSGSTVDLDAGSVVVGVDGSERGIDALAWTLDAFPWREVITAAYAHPQVRWSETSEGQAVRERVEKHAAETLEASIDAALASTNTPDRLVRGGVLDGDPRTTLVDTMAPDGLLVLGERGHSGLAGVVLGSLADYALYNCPSSMIICRK